MSRNQYRSISGVLTILACMTLAVPNMRGQSCFCATTQEVTKRIDICYNNIIQQVDVTYCGETFCPPQQMATAEPCNTPNDPISARTTISRICPVGFIPTNAQNLMNATIAAMGLCCGDQAGLFGCTAATMGHQWIVRWPKCVQFDAMGCLAGCTGSPCCGFRVLFEPNQPPGVCRTTILENCSDTFACPSGSTCIELTCEYPLRCCW